MTPRLVRRRYSKGLVLLAVWRNGYKNRGMWAARNAELEGTNTHTCIWKALNASKHRPWCSLRPINTWFPNGTTDRVLTELETSHLNQQHNITSHVKYTSRSLSTENSAVGIVSVCVCWLPRLHMWGHTLQQRQRVTHSVGLMSRQCCRVNRRVDVHDFLQKISTILSELGNGTNIMLLDTIQFVHFGILRQNL